MSVQDFFRAEGESVWMGKDLAISREWLVQLPEVTLREIDVCVEALRKRDVNLNGLRAEDIPLKSFAAGIESIRRDLESGRGFVVLQGLDVEKYSLNEAKMIYWSLGRRLGLPKAQSYLGDLIGDIRDVSDEEPDHRKRRAYHSGGEQPTHTDSFDIVSMLSLQMAKVGGESRLCSAHTVHNLMLDNCPGLLRQFYEGFKYRTTDTDSAAQGKAAFTGERKPAFALKNGQLICSFVRGYIERAVNAGDYRLTPVEKAALEAFQSFSNHPDVCLDYILRPGDMQFFNNRILLHGRKSFEDHPEKERRRHLLRLWLSVPKWQQEVHSEAAMEKWNKPQQATGQIDPSILL